MQLILLGKLIDKLGSEHRVGIDMRSGVCFDDLSGLPLNLKLGSSSNRNDRKKLPPRHSDGSEHCPLTGMSIAYRKILKQVRALRELDRYWPERRAGAPKRQGSGERRQPALGKGDACSNAYGVFLGIAC
jgi:hypothetical protein